MREYLPEALIGMIAKPYLLEDWMTEEIEDYLVLGYLELTGANSIWLSEPREFWTKKRVEKYQKKGIKVNHHLFDDNKSEYLRLLELNIDCCTVDDLSVLNYRK